MNDFLRKLAEKASTREAILKNIDRMLLFLALSALFLNIFTCIKVYADAPINERASRPLIAAAANLFYNSGPLEPVPVAALRLPMLITKANPVKIQRIEGCIVLVLLFIVLTKTLSYRISRTAAFYSAIIFAGIPWVGYYAMTGSSFLFAMLFLLLYWDFADTARLNNMRAFWAGVFAAAACLSCTESIFFVLINTIFFLPEYKSGKLLKKLALTWLVLLFFAAPYYIWQGAKFGNIFYGQEMGLTRLINAEIQNTNANKNFIEQAITLPQFLLRDGLYAGLKAPFTGLLRALSYEFPRAVYYKLAMFLAFLGFYFAFVNEKKAIYSLFLSAFIPICFFAGMNIVSDIGGIPLEYYLPALLGVTAASGYGLMESCRAVVEFIVKKQAAKFK